jgi:ribonuclease P protein component
VNAEAAAPPVGRLVRSVDFERVLRSRSRMLSAHFALHHLPDVPSLPRRALPRLSQTDLSTGAGTNEVHSVDDFRGPVLETLTLAASPPGAKPATPRLWLGAVVPKRHARRSVTRTLLKRQIRAAVSAHADRIAAGIWVVRLRAGFDRTTYMSAASNALRAAARDELEHLLLLACAEAPRPLPA